MIAPSASCLRLPEVHLARDQPQVVVASQAGGPDPAVSGACPVAVQQRRGRIRRGQDRPPGARDRGIGDRDADRLRIHRRLDDQRVDDPVALGSVDRDVDRGGALRDDERCGELGVLRVARMQDRQRLAAVHPGHLEAGEVVAEGQVAGEEAQAIATRRQAPDPEHARRGPEHEVAPGGYAAPVPDGESGRRDPPEPPPLVVGLRAHPHVARGRRRSRAAEVQPERARCTMCGPRVGHPCRRGPSVPARTARRPVFMRPTPFPKASEPQEPERCKRLRKRLRTLPSPRTTWQG